MSATVAGALLGWGVFSTLGIWDGRAFAIEHHLARLRRDAATLEVPLHFDDAAISKALQSLIAHNQVRDGLARLTATRRGDGRWNEDETGDLSIVARSAEHASSTPLRLALSPYQIGARHPLAGIKSTSYAGHGRIWREVQRRGYDEAVVCSEGGMLCEAARANLFWVRRGELYTPSLECGPLPGIARQLVLHWAQQMGLKVHQDAFSLRELMGADEVFLSAATSGPRAAQSFCDAKGIEQVYDAPGPLTHRLQERWKEAVRTA